MNEFKVGLLALATLVSVVFMSLKITSNQSGFGKYETYRTILDDATGIFPKTPIKIAGIPAGRIQKIELQGNNALITFEVLKEIKITKNSKVRIKSVGFLGDKYIEILVGDDTEKLAANEFVESQEAPGMETLVKDASEVLVDVKAIVKSMKDSIAPEGQEPPIKAILADVSELVKNTKEVTASLKRVMGANEERLNNIAANLEIFTEELANNMDKGNPESVMSDLKRILANTEAVTADLQSIVADVKHGKGTVGKLLVEDEIADQVKDTLAGVQKLVGKANQLRTEISVFAGANTNSESDTEVALRLYPSPERFYHFGLVTSEFGPEKEKIFETTQNGSTTIRNEKEREKDSYRFNVQIGRRINDWVIRGGLIESTGGFGVDYYIRDLSTKLSLEAFDYRKNKGPNFRFMTEVQLWNVLYGRASIEDFARKERVGIFQAGLRFNDEDLKGIIGFFL